MTIFLLTEEQHSDSICFGVTFKPEAFLNEELAEMRKKELSEQLQDGDGSFYSIQEIELIDGGCIVAME